MEPQIDPEQQAIKEQIAQLEKQQEEAKNRAANDLKTRASYGVQYCSLCHNQRTPNHKLTCTGACPNWKRTEDGEIKDACGYPTEERKRKYHEDREYGYKIDVMKKRLAKKEAKSKNKNATQVTKVVMVVL